MTRRLMLLLLLGLAAYPAIAQPGPGLSGDRRWRAPVATIGDLPASAGWGTVQNVAGTLYWWDGDSWEAVGAGGAHTHSEYAVLAGVAGGQILRGGTATGEDLEVRANAAALTPSAILYGTAGVVRPGAVVVKAAGASGFIELNSPSGDGFVSVDDAAVTVGSAGVQARVAAASGITMSGDLHIETASGVALLDFSQIRTAATDDDVPDAGDFGALALTGPVTSTGLATAISADAVALGTQTSGGYASSASEGGPAASVAANSVALGADTTGGYAASASEAGPAASVAADSVPLGTATTGSYVSSATASQGLTLTGTEGASLGLQDCAASEVLKRNAGDTAWECAAIAGGIGGSTGSTDNAILRADGTGGATTQSSLTTIDDAGAVTIPDGSAAATGLRFSSFAVGTGFFGNGPTTLSFAQNGVAKWNISNAAIYSQNGSYFYNAGAGSPVFMPGNGDLDSGLGANAADDMAMWAGNGIVERWLRPTAGVWRSLNLGQVADSPQAVTCADNGTGTAAALTINPTGAAVYITNSDANGCTVTLGETNVTSGQRVELVVVSNAGGTVDFSDTAGVTELAGVFTASLYDSLALRYIADRWIETGRSDN